MGRAQLVPGAQRRLLGASNRNILREIRKLGADSVDDIAQVGQRLFPLQQLSVVPRAHDDTHHLTGALNQDK
jgi:hypothetical protein